MENEQSANKDTINIALAFSGGGYRAAAFNLGAMSYLKELPVGDSSLLEKVRVLSTVSGGTITGTRYAIGIQRGETFSQIYHALYAFMINTDLVNLSLDALIKTNHWAEGRVRSLINAIADAYDKHLFDGALFAELMTEEPGIHLRHMSFNATEFANGLQFRFQWSEKILNPGPDEHDRGIIGNKNYCVPAHVARQIRMADILAASSCFPGGFEPINFPTDFIAPKGEALEMFKVDPKYPVGLMDGGIVDNQGIEPILLANSRMICNRNKLANSPGDKQNAIDLIIVSDVASPYLEDYKASVQHKENWWRRLTPKAIFFINGALLLLCLSLLAFFIYRDRVWPAVVFTALSTLSMLVFILVGFIKSIPEKFNVPSHFLQPLGKLLRLKLLVYENMISNRIDSLLKMTSNVFLKHVRSLNYKTIYNNDSWMNRRIMNAIYELRPGEEELKEKLAKGKIPPYLTPSKKMQLVAAQAASMDTTLWFSEEEKNGKMLDVIIACGQFTLCWNLLEYVEKLKINADNTTEAHKILTGLESQLVSHWEQFQKNPCWLVEKYHQLRNTSKR